MPTVGGRCRLAQDAGDWWFDERFQGHTTKLRSLQDDLLLRSVTRPLAQPGDGRPGDPAVVGRPADHRAVTDERPLPVDHGGDGVGADSGDRSVRRDNSGRSVASAMYSPVGTGAAATWSIGAAMIDISANSPAPSESRPSRARRRYFRWRRARRGHRWQFRQASTEITRKQIAPFCRDADRSITLGNQSIASARPAVRSRAQTEVLLRDLWCREHRRRHARLSGNVRDSSIASCHSRSNERPA